MRRATDGQGQRLCRAVGEGGLRARLSAASTCLAIAGAVGTGAGIAVSISAGIDVLDHVCGGFFRVGFGHEARKRTARSRVPRRACHLCGYGTRPRRRLQRSTRTSPIEPCLGSPVSVPELHGPLQHFLGALSVSASQEHLAEPAVHSPVARRGLARGDKHGLRVHEAAGLDVHPRHRDHDRYVARESLFGELAQLLHERDVRSFAERFAESDGCCRARFCFQRWTKSSIMSPTRSGLSCPAFNANYPPMIVRCSRPRRETNNACARVCVGEGGMLLPTENHHVRLSACPPVRLSACPPVRPERERGILRAELPKLVRREGAE